ncbi:MAG: helix-turn-helix domain-containing protein [Sulfolobales archaeon]
MNSISELIGGDELAVIRDFFSLTEYEAKAYIALILVGPTGISRLSQVAGIPRTKCYSVARSLITKGLAVRISSRPFVIDAVKPEVVSNKLAEDLCMMAREKAARIVETINRLAEKAGARSPRRRGDQELAGVVMIESIEGLISMLIEDIERASKEILIATSNMPMEFPWRELLIPSIKALSRGVVIEYAAPRGSPAIRHIKMLLEGHINMVQMQQTSLTEGFSDTSIIDRFRLYESDYIESPFIVIDEEITYNIFADPIRRRHMFTTRIHNSRYARSMKIYFKMLTKG